jgi:hypothetical protein
MVSPSVTETTGTSVPGTEVTVGGGMVVVEIGVEPVVVLVAGRVVGVVAVVAVVAVGELDEVASAGALVGGAVSGGEVVVPAVPPQETRASAANPATAPRKRQCPLPGRRLLIL